jgi:hypothetical protein
VPKGIGMEGKRGREVPEAIRSEIQKWLADLGF